jgi:hypothetical protein
MSPSNDEQFWQEFKASVGVGKTFHMAKLGVCCLLAVFFLAALVTGKGGTPAGIGLMLAVCLYFAGTSAKLLFIDAKRPRQ